MSNKSHEIGVYVDDIPMRLSERYRPLDVSAFTEEVVEIPDLFDHNYKFSAELYALESSELRQKQKLKQISDSMKSFDLKNDNHFRDNESNISQTKSRTVETKCDNKTKNSIHLNPGEILKPLLTFKGSTKTSDNYYKINDKSIETNDSNVNIKRKLVKDFESDTSSPFDFVELQTIDDMQELNDVFRVFQSKSIQTKHSINENNVKSNENNESLNQIICEQNPSDSQHLNGLNVLDAYGYQIANGSALTNPTAAHYGPLSSTANWVLSTSVDGTGSSSYNSTQTNHLPNSDHNVLRSSKSASDLPTLVNSEESVKTPKTQRSHTPPCASTKAKSKKYRKEKQTLVLNDPYEELSDKSKQFVESISSMGFDRSRVARAVKYIDNDHKKVIDFLLQVQTLEESGHDCCESEIALHMNNYHILDAKKFLEALRQLSECGFDKREIIKVLVKCNNDRDKALDILLNTDTDS